MSEMRPTVIVDNHYRTVLISDGTIYPGENYVPAGCEGYQIVYRNCRLLGPRSTWATSSREDEE